MSDWISLVSLVVLCLFFGYLMWTSRQMSRYDDPEYRKRQDEHAMRALLAAEKQAEALERISRR